MNRLSFLASSPRAIEWGIAEFGPIDPSICTRQTRDFMQHEVSDAYVEQVITSQPLLDVVAQSQRMNLDRDAYMAKLIHYARIGLSSGALISPCRRKGEGSCSQVRCIEHGEAEAMTRMRIAGEVASKARYTYTALFHDAGPLDSFSPEAFRAVRAEEVFVARLQADGPVGMVMVVEISPTGYVHAHSLITSSREIHECEDETVTLRRIRPGTERNFAFYMAKDVRDPLMRAGALALNRGRWAQTFGGFYGPGGLAQARKSFPWQSRSWAPRT